MSMDSLSCAVAFRASIGKLAKFWLRLVTIAGSHSTPKRIVNPNSTMKLRLDLVMKMLPHYLNHAIEVSFGTSEIQRLVT